MGSILFLTLLLAVTPALAQASAHASVPCAVRIRSKASADYNPASEFLLKGKVSEAGNGILKLRLPFGVVRIQVGSSFHGDSLTIGQEVEVVASSWQDDLGQHVVGREIRHGGGILVLRDAQGVPSHS
jgi:hypothetical protein